MISVNLTKDIVTERSLLMSGVPQVAESMKRIMEELLLMGR